MDQLTFGELFAGIGGFGLGFERASMKCVYQIEKDKQCNGVLARHWPNVERFEDVTKFLEYELPATDIICGGDPCQSHSRARTMPGKYPNLSGYFLALVGRLRPRWVVRENVLAPTVEHFAAALEALGYRTVIVRVDARAFMPQSRIRDFVIGSLERTRQDLIEMFPDANRSAGTHTAHLKQEQIVSCLTTREKRYDSRDNYIYESGGLRIMDGDERERVSGFPTGWTAGLSETTRARMYGNAVVPQVVEYIGRGILKAEAKHDHAQ